MNFIPKDVRYRIAPYFLFDEARADEFPGKYDPEEHMPQAIVAKMHDDGAICVKTYFEPGFGLPGRFALTHQRDYAGSGNRRKREGNAGAAARQFAIRSSFWS